LNKFIILQTVLDTTLTVLLALNSERLVDYTKIKPLMAQEAHKPMFHLKPADGGIGANIQAVQSAYRDFNQLAQKIAVLVQTPINYLT
jgi:hypothetical protein